MPIPMKCACGKKLALKDELAGKKVKCPACQQVLSVPKPKVVEEPDEPWEVDDPSDDDFDEDVAPAKSQRGKKSASSGAKGKKGKKGKKQAGSSLGLIIGLATGGGLLVVGLVVWLLLPGKPAENVAANPDGTGTGTNAATGGPAGSGGPAANTPQLPRAVKQLPDWLIAQAPFDAKAYWTTVPEDKNAAPLYLEAFYEFSPLMQNCFPENIRVQRTPVIQARYDRSFEFRSKHSTDVARRDAVLDEHQEAFRKLQAAQQRPLCVFDYGMDTPSLFPVIITARDVHRLAGLQIERDLAKQDFDHAIETVESVFRLSRDLRPRAPLLVNLVAQALDSMSAHQAIQILKSPGLQISHCDRLLKLLEQHESRLVEIDPWATMQKGEFIRNSFLLHDLQHAEGEFAPARIGNAFGVPSKSRIDAIFNAYNGDDSTIKKNLGTEMEGARRMFTHTCDMFLEVLPGKDFDFKAEADQLTNKYRVLTETASRPYGERVSAAEKLSWANTMRPLNEWAKTQPEIKSEEQMISAMRKAIADGVVKGPFVLIPIARMKLENDLAGSNEVDDDLLAKSRLQGLVGLAALRRWHAAHAEPPPNLVTLCREAGRERLPEDAYTGAPLKMRTFTVDTPLKNGLGQMNDTKLFAGETILYSIGNDGVDHEGVIQKWGPNEGDNVFRLDVPPATLKTARQ